MGKKRSVASILNSVPSSSNQNSPSTEDIKITTRKRSKVNCFCSKCKGRLVDLRTKNDHDQKGETTSLPSPIINISSTETPMLQLLVEPPVDEEYSTRSIIDDNDVLEELMEDNDVLEEELEDNDVLEEELVNDDDALEEQQTFTFLPRKKKRTATFRHVITPSEGNEGNFENSEDSDSNSSTENDEGEDGGNNAEFLNNFEDYHHPTFDPLPDTPELPNQDRNMWILMWIMKFRSNFKLPDTATEALIKFVRIILEECGGSEYESFPKSLYLARQTLGLVDSFMCFAACPKCHKLYKKDDVTNIQQTIMKCSHIEFPNSATKRLKQCRTPLAKQVTLNNSITFRPELVYPVASIQQQLSNMFLRSGFESSLRHWTNRLHPDNTLSDIYDGQVWRNFKDEQESDCFFRPEKADNHLGLILNLDWFQPYDGAIYSTGVLYAAICNLPRNVRFRPENMLILGILPGPNEVSLHKINHYLSPIITELETLWEGITIN